MSLRGALSRLTGSRIALPISFVLGFLENSVVLFAMEPLFIPMMASRGRQAWRIASALVLGAVTGGVALYYLGAYADEPVIQPLFERLGLQETYHDANQKLREDGFFSMFFIALTPFPFQFGAAAAGAASLPMPLFVLACVLGRGIRYFFYAGLIMLLGRRAEHWIEEHELELFVAGVFIFLGFAVYMLVSAIWPGAWSELWTMATD